MENNNHVKNAEVVALVTVLVISTILLVGFISKLVSQEGRQEDAQKPEDTTYSQPEKTTTTEYYNRQTTTSTITSSTTTTTIKKLQVTGTPKPVYKGDMENNQGRFFINKTVVFNDTSGVQRVAGVVRQLYEIDEEDIAQYNAEEVYIRYWNGTWAIYH